MSEKANHQVGHMTQYERAAYDLGARAAEDAASWTVDGSTDPAHAVRLLRMMADCDYKLPEHLPRQPDLSGELAGHPTPSTLASQVTGRGFHLLDSDEVIGISDAFDEGVSDTFELACEMQLRAFLEVPDERALTDWLRDWCDYCDYNRCDHLYGEGCGSFTEGEHPGTFSLTIETGNAAMSTVEDVVSALHRTAESLMVGEGKIRDANGNTVGEWRFEA